MLFALLLCPKDEDEAKKVFFERKMRAEFLLCLLIQLYFCKFNFNVEQEHNDESHNLKGLVIGDQYSKRIIFIVHLSGNTVTQQAGVFCSNQ